MKHSETNPSSPLNLGWLPKVLLLGITMGFFYPQKSLAKGSPSPSFTMPQPKSRSERSYGKRNTGEMFGPPYAPKAWYHPSLALGLGASIPNALPIEGYLLFGRWFAFKAYYLPALPLSIRVEIPSDVISAKQGLAVANPEFAARFKGSFGGGWGADFMVMPFGGSFFLSGGISQQRLGIKGNASAPILACSILEAAKEPPCGDPEKRLETKTQVVVQAEAVTASYVNNIQAGWFAKIGGSGYFTFRFGYGRPWHIKRNANITASLDGPSSSPDDITGALADIRGEKEGEMRTKVLQEIRRLDEKGLPIVAVGAGIFI